MKNVLVIFGGKSVEHDVSIITGVMTANSIDRQKYNVIPVLITANGQWVSGRQLFDIDGYKTLDEDKLDRVTLTCGSSTLYKIKGKKLKPIAPIYVAINCLHGGIGEDGSIAGLIKSCEIPLASPSVLSSAVSLNKRFTKTVLKGLGVRTLSCNSVYSTQQAHELKDELIYPVMVKPNLLGSSIGVEKVSNSEDLCQAVNQALRYGECAIIEPCLQDFIEINCSAYLDLDGNINISECERPIGKTCLLSFGDKYQSGGRVFPADIDKNVSEKIKRITKKVYYECEFSGIIRIDYFVKQGKIYLNEINSVPGSLAYYLFCDTLKEFTNLLDRLIERAISDYAKKSTYYTKYASSILNGFGAKGCKPKRKS